MRTKFWLLGCLLVLGCNSSNNVPDGVLEKEEMVDVLIDAYLAQAKVTHVRKIERDSSEQLYKYYQQYILEGKEIDSTTFFTSLSFYFEHPKLFNEINEVVLDSLNLRLEKMEAQEEKDRKEREEGKSDREKINRSKKV